MAVIFTAGALTTAVIDTPGRWAAAFALCCLGGIPFTLYGIMSATWLMHYVFFSLKNTV